MLSIQRSLPALILLACISCVANQRQTAAPVSMPLTFEINRGQSAPEVHFLARAREGVMFFTAEGLTVAIPQVGSFRMLFEPGAASRVSGEQMLPARSNYLARRNGPGISNVENFGAVRYSSVYPGIDVKFYGRERHLEHDFLLAPGADPSRISLRLEGIDPITLQNDGSLKLALGNTNLFETAPLAWQVVGGNRIPIRASWKLLAENRVGIGLGTYDRTLPVTIDPVLVYSTHLGGTTGEDLSLNTSFPADTFISFIRLDPDGNIYVAGRTSATDYPTTAGAFDRNPNSQEIFHSDATTQSGFVSKFDPTGHILLYSTFIRVTVDGQVYTTEAQFNESPGPNFGFDLGIFLDKISADGSKLLYSNQFALTTNSSVECQSNSSSFPGALAVDNAGHAWLAGNTTNPCLPATPGAFQTKLPNTSNTGFAAKFDTNKPPAESLVYSTYLGGSHMDSANAVTVDSAGAAYIAGATSSPDFPHSRAFGTDTANSAFVLKLNPAGSTPEFSTLIHGVTNFFESVIGIVLDSSKNVYIAGSTESTGFPTTAGAFKRALSGTNCTDIINGNPGRPCPEGYVTKLNPNASALVYSTLLGGSGGDSIKGLGLNNRGMAFVTGRASSSDFPTTANAFKKTLPASATNAFVTALQPDGGSLYYSTLLGGSKNTSGAAIFVDPAWNAWVGGNTQDSDFPVTPDAFQPGLKGNSDGFISKVVIAADLNVSLQAARSPIPKHSVETFIARVTNKGPDGSDAIALTDPIPAGFQFIGISGSTATSCSGPATGATSGAVICHKTRLENGQTFGVNILLRAVARPGSLITNKVAISARTQDLNQSNNSASASVQVR